MKPQERVADIYLKQSSQITFKETSSWDFDSDSLVHVIEPHSNGKMVGDFGATFREIKLTELNKYRCREEMESLIKQNPSLILPSGNIYVAEVKSAFLDEDYRNKGLGVKGYLRLAKLLFEKKAKRKPFLFIPNYCNYVGNTSQSAMRVWETLSRKYTSDYDVLLIDK